jgi:hypothetical protein
MNSLLERGDMLIVVLELLSRSAVTPLRLPYSSGTLLLVGSLLGVSTLVNYLMRSHLYNRPFTRFWILFVEPTSCEHVLLEASHDGSELLPSRTCQLQVLGAFFGVLRWKHFRLTIFRDNVRHQTRLGLGKTMHRC